LAVLGPAWLKAKQAWHYTTVLIDSSQFLEWLQTECQAHNIAFKQQLVCQLNLILIQL
jgi:hypothetical protein